MKKTGLILLVIVVVIAALAVWSSSQPQATLEVVRAKVDTIRAFIDERAITELPDDYLVSMPISGWLEEIKLREGDLVKKGDVIARLEKGDLEDRASQAEQRIAVLQTKIDRTSDHRLEDNMMIEAQATVKAIDETVRAAEAKNEASKAVVDFALAEVERLQKLHESAAAADRETRRAETDYRQAKAEYQSDLLELAALKTLAAVSYIGPKFIADYKDRKSFDLATHKQQLEEARAQLEIEKRNLARAEIKSPIDGVVLNRHRTRRQFLSAGTPLLTIGRLDDMNVTAEVLTERATRIATGNPVEIYGEAIVDGPIVGQVLRVYPAGFKKISSLGVEQQRVKTTIKLDRRPARLGVGFRVHVRIMYDEADDALTLPRTAMFRGKDGTWQVMVVADGLTDRRAITVGLMNENLAQIVKGVNETDLIVAHPSREIVAGMKVRTVGGE